MERVIIESPYAGDIDRNTLYARQCIRHSIHRDEAPIASHLLYTQPGILNDLVAEERALGMKAGWAWLKWANIVAFYIDQGISNGMLKGLDAVHKIRIESITNYPKLEVRSIHTARVIPLTILLNQKPEEILASSTESLLQFIASDGRLVSDEPVLKIPTSQDQSSMEEGRGLRRKDLSDPGRS